MSEFFLKAFNTIMAFIHWGILKLVPRSHPILGEVANPIVFGSQQGIYWLAQKMFKLMKDERERGRTAKQLKEHGRNYYKLSSSTNSRNRLSKRAKKLKEKKFKK